MDEKDFNNWISFKPEWKEISFQYTTGRNFQHEQDLKAVFFHSYIYYEQKFKVYFEKFNKIPYDFFNDLIFDFKQNFPKDESRIKGINYFDDLIEQLIDHYKAQTSKQPDLTGFKSNLDDKQIQTLFDQLKGNYIDKNTNKDHFKAIFKDEPLPDNFKKIKWNKAKNLLAYFVDKLFFKSEPHLWAKAKNCFDNAKNLAQLKDLYINNKTGTPKKSNDIDTIINKLDTPL